MVSRRGFSPKETGRPVAGTTVQRGLYHVFLDVVQLDSPRFCKDLRMASDPAAQSWPAEWYPPFLLTLRATGNIGAACQAAGISRLGAMRARQVFPRFRAAWDEALEDAVDVLEAEARRRALAGSDFLLWKMLSSLRRRVYSERVDIDVAIRQKVDAMAALHKLNPDDVYAEMEQIIRGQDPIEVHAQVLPAPAGARAEEGDGT